MPANSIFAITQAVVTGTNLITYSGAVTSGITFGTQTNGSPLLVGMPMIVRGCTTTAFNGTFVITGGNLTTTFTATISHANATEAETATGTCDPEALNGVGASPSSIVGGLGYGIKIPLPLNDIDYGNFIPGTIVGGSQMIIDF
jgi:hypothetical protein